VNGKHDYRVIGSGRCYGVEMDVEGGGGGQAKVLRISRQSSAIQILTDEVPPKNVEYFSYLGCMVTNSRGLPLQSSIQQDEDSFHHQIGLKCNKETSDVLLGFGGLEVAYWPLVPKFAFSNLAEAVGFFGRKNPQHAFLRRGSKAVCPMSCFTACKRTQK
jgi:hypothetical protein